MRNDKLDVVYYGVSKCVRVREDDSNYNYALKSLVFN